MTINEYFNIEVWLSKDCYLSKPTQIDYSRMSWEHLSMTVSEFMDKILQGYSYCHIYYGSRRSKDKFHFSQVVSIDVDDTETSLADFIETCPLKPTFAYETFSNGKDGLYSYRLAFVFQEKLNAGQYKCAYEKIEAQIGLTETKDHCGKVLSQLMNGTTSDAYMFRSNIIYSVNSDVILDNYDEDQVISTVNSRKNFHKSKFNLNFSNNYNIIFNNKKQYKSKEPFGKNYFEEIEEPLSLLMADRKMFLEFYHQIFKTLIRWSKLEYNEAGYCVIPEDHLSLFVRYGYCDGRCVVNRFKDGEKRRIRLYIDGCIMRKIKPDVTFLELLYNMVHRVYYYYDNSDGILSNELIIQKAIDVMNSDVESMEFASLDAGRITTSAGYCKNHNTTRQSYSRKAMMIENYAGISEWYDKTKSILANHKWAIDNGIDISLSTLKRFCKYNNIQSGDKLPVSEWYHPWLSVQRNLYYAKISGIKTSKNTLYRYCKANGIPTKGTAEDCD